MYRLTYFRRPEGERYDTATQAIRGMARAVHALPLTVGERRAFDIWYTRRNYRASAQRLRAGNRYTLGVMVQGTRRLFVIEPPPPLSFQHAPQTPVVRVELAPQRATGAEAPCTSPDTG